MARPRPSAKKKAADPGAALGPEAGPTFGEVLARDGMIEKVSRATRGVISQTTEAAVERARTRLTVVSCVDCTAAKTCCSLVTSAYLHEAVPIAARLIAEGRDTPALRDLLKAAAHRMETTRTERYQQPCVFLDGDERCTIYEDRPSVCGTHLVSSPPATCSDPHGIVSKIVGPLQDTVPPQLEGEFRLLLGLRPLERPYRGALPRMVLLCLEAWSRRDYVTFLADRVLPAAHRYAWATR